MTQTTYAHSFADAEVEYSTDGAAWNPISGESVSCAFDGFDLASADEHTGDSDLPIVLFGKFGSGTMTVRALGLSGNDGVIEAAETAYAAKSAFYLRCFPNGKTVGYRSYTSSVGKIIKPPFAMAGEYGSAAAVAGEVQIRCASITPDDYATT